MTNKTLRELVGMQQFNQKTDIEVIIDYFVENGLESKGIDIMNILSKAKCDKLENELGSIKGNLTMYGGAEVLYKEFGIEVGGKLNRIIVLFILGFDIEKEYPPYYEWLKETIPTLKQPKIFWRYFADWLNDNGIYFKNDKKEI